MQKAAAKAKGKEKTARTPKNDEMSIASKLNNMQPSPAAATKGAKDKLRPPRHPSGKKSIGVKPAPTQALLEVENVVEDRASHENSQSALQDTFRLKGKKARSKDCEEAVNAALTEFWDSAWNICAERFFINTAPITVSFELRNAWLRIAEAEWQDLDMRETPNTRPNRIFKRDEPPLPLAFDTWSRGAVEILPRFRHESVMDPFLRDLFDPIQVDQSEILEEMDEEEEDEDEEEMSHEVDEGEADEGGAGDHLVVIKAPAVPDDNWQLDLDDEYRLLKTEKTVSPPKIESPPKLSGESEMVLAVEPPVMFLLSPRSISMEESVTDVESASPSRAPTTYSSRKSQVRRKFSPGQCGGQVGSGVFRFPTETTSEAIRRMQENIRDHHRQSHVQIIDEDRVAYKQKRSVRSDDDMVVQPLFEEQTPRSATGHDNANRFHELSWRGVSYTAGQSNRGPSIDNVTADMDRKFLQRKLVNLHSRFKKQSIKYFGKTAKTVEDAADTVSLMDSIQRSSTNSSFKSKNSKKGGVFDKRKFTRGAGVNTKYASRSLLALGGNVVRTQSHVKATSSKAKGTTSDPGLPKRNKDTMVASLLERRLKAENSEPRDNNKQKGGDRAFGGGGARDFTASGGGGGGGGGGFSTAGDRYKIGGGGGGGGIQFSNGLRGTSRMEILDPELMRNKRLRYCKNCPTATNTSSS